MTRGTVFEYDGLRFKAQDDDIMQLLENAYWCEKTGGCKLKTAVLVALCCQRITLADLPIPVGCI